MNPIKSIGRALDSGWFSRLIMVSIVWFAWSLADWGMAYAGTVLAMGAGKPETLGPAMQSAAMVIGAVGVLPIALLTWGLNAYIQTRAVQPRVILPGGEGDRRTPS